jgi:tryptophan halogenase
MPVLATNLTEKILRLAKDLNTPYLYERSFKMSDREVLDNRLLMSFRVARLDSDPPSVLARICDTISIPSAYRPMIASQIHEADNIHLGFEEGSDGFLYKFYLEFARRFRQSAANAREFCGPLLLHLAFKWDPNCDSIRTIARYTCDPGLHPAGMQRRLSQVYADRAGTPSHRFASGLLEKAARRIPVDSLFFLAVEEEDNPRKSFDMCIYDANFPLFDLESELVAIGRYFQIPEERFRQVYEPIKHEKLGHLSGGVGRSGKEFCTIYYGARLHDPATCHQGGTVSR